MEKSIGRLFLMIWFGKLNFSSKDILSYISKARSGSGIFNAEKMSVYVPLGTQQMLSDYGYHIVTE